MTKAKEYKLYFHKVETETSEDGCSLTDIINSCVDGKINPPHKLSDKYYIQVQNLKTINSGRVKMICGVMKKFRNDDLPKIGKIGEVQERRIEMADDESLIEKTHFLFNTKNNILLYQQNHLGTSCKAFMEYMGSLAKPYKKFYFAPIMKSRIYEMLRDDSLKMKQFQVKMARPTSTELVKNASHKWNDSALSYLLDKFGGSSVVLSIKGSTLKKGANRVFLHESTRKFIEDCIGFFSEKKDGGQVEFLDEDSVSHPVDLVADRMFDIVNVPMDGRYPNSENFFNIMKETMVNSYSELEKIFGKSD